MHDTEQLPPADAGRLEAPVGPLTLEDCEHLFWLAARDYVFFGTYNEETGDWDGGWHAAVNCNDTFYYASADACGLKPNEAKEVRSAIEQWGWAGAVAWCALKRNEEPLEQLQTEQYRAAMLALRPNVPLGLDVMKPAAWEWHDINGDQQVNWHCKPPNASGALYRRAAIDRVLAHAKEVHATSEHMHDRNNALRLYVSDLTAVMLRMVAGIDHLSELARQWEPDHSSGADRRGWVLAKDARDDAWRLLQEHAQRIGPNGPVEPAPKGSARTGC